MRVQYVEMLSSGIVVLDCRSRADQDRDTFENWEGMTITRQDNNKLARRVVSASDWL
jgi:hypothetical protein